MVKLEVIFMKNEIVDFVVCVIVLDFLRVGMKFKWFGEMSVKWNEVSDG